MDMAFKNQKLCLQFYTYLNRSASLIIDKYLRQIELSEIYAMGSLQCIAIK